MNDSETSVSLNTFGPEGTGLRMLVLREGGDEEMIFTGFESLVLVCFLEVGV